MSRLKMRSKRFKTPGWYSYLVHLEPAGDDHEHCSGESEESVPGPWLYTPPQTSHLDYKVLPQQK